MKAYFRKFLLYAWSGGLPVLTLLLGQASGAVRASEVAVLETQKTAYALGLLYGQMASRDLKTQQQLGITLSADEVCQGIQDGLLQQGKLEQSEMQTLLGQLNQQISQRAAAKQKEEAEQQLQQGEQFRQQFAREKGVSKQKSGLLYQIIRPGKGAAPKASDTVVVHYTGKLIDGSCFDSSYDRSEPITLLLNQVIAGWTEGLQQIKKGGKIKLVVPPKLAYGEQGNGPIPGNATLIFEVELIDINPPPKKSMVSGAGDVPAEGGEASR